MKGYIEDRKITFDTITNELKIVAQEKEITENPTSYYSKRSKIFYQRFGERIDTILRINKKQEFMLNEVKRILTKNNTNYKVVLTPLYEQMKYSRVDFLILKKIFGDKLYDFTGKNSFTDIKTNYYETNHFRPNVGDSILQLIYQPVR